MHKHQCDSAQHVTLKGPCCEEFFESNTCNLKIGGALLCPNCRSLFFCRAKELFAALKHINQMVS